MIVCLSFKAASGRHSFDASHSGWNPGPGSYASPGAGFYLAGCLCSHDIRDAFISRLTKPSSSGWTARVASRWIWNEVAQRLLRLSFVNIFSRLCHVQSDLGLRSKQSHLFPSHFGRKTAF